MVEFLSGAINRNVLDYQIAHMEVSLDFLSTFYILFNDNVEKNAIKGPFVSDPKMVSIFAVTITFSGRKCPRTNENGNLL